ncbi:MAG: NAD-dependent succinate-semialdehyde dehydrogenase [Novosphingobium lindaniclasticum]|jgi:succinate-semialdehyde dehydrogenase/glutarate-semialdehyde dehydrogenase|uniref:NAD-dependent succinate-semialdehyde dehydrogenase n=1 Tax=Novosphingobium lindaniclasticum TaxID=1329895 RepID=UPI002409C2B8|nr:NAD-dependent succinate-semialdehyde dehydrogenase [Novosphingobium lindaniclasticum]MDF2638627.1 NAD-dependent succinate-semialdehyde dehydrogenase [Novosphingobium lindaniclasticum]
MTIRNLHPFREQAFVGGIWTTAPETVPVTDPATGEVIAHVPHLGADETRTAIDAAAKAQAEWRHRPAGERADLLLRWHGLMLEHQEALAAILTAEQGKPLAEAKGEVLYAASFVRWFAEEARRIEGEVIPAPRSNQRILVWSEPVGVVAAITPWNFPAAMVTRKVAPALAAGCAIIVKPAPETPLTALALAALAEEAGLPAGLLSVVTGEATAIGGAFMASDVVRKLSFTGSTGVGRKLYEQSAPTLKRLSLELGGNAPFLVFDDADVDAAVEGALLGKYRNAGQTCVCVNRFLVQDGIHDAFVERLRQRVEGLVVGRGTEAGVTIGPLINARAVEKVEQHVADAVARGGRLLAGGARQEGLFFPPTLIADVPRDALVASEETFGPLAAVIRFETEEEAIRMANDTELGLAAYAYTRDIGRAMRVAGALEYGMVGLNEAAISTEVAPFGGIKASGMGREGSRHGITDYLELKYVMMGGL